MLIANKPEKIQKQPSRGVLKKKCSENMRQIYPCQSVILIMLLCNFTETTLLYGCSLVNLLHIFGRFFPKNTSGGPLLKIERIKNVLRWSNKIALDGFCS